MRRKGKEEGSRYRRKCRRVEGKDEEGGASRDMKKKREKGLVDGS